MKSKLLWLIVEKGAALVVAAVVLQVFLVVLSAAKASGVSITQLLEAVFASSL